VPELNPIQQQELAAEIARVVALREQEDRQRKTLQGNADALVARIQELRAELDQSAAQLLGVAQELQRSVRGNPDTAGVYMPFVNGHLRMAGAVQLVVKRTGVTDRMLTAGKQRQEEDSKRAALKDEANQKKAYQKHIEAMAENSFSALADLFDEDVE